MSSLFSPDRTVLCIHLATAENASQGWWRKGFWLLLFLIFPAHEPGQGSGQTVESAKITLRGEIRSEESGELLPARLYLSQPSDQGTTWFFAKSAAKDGTVAEYRKHRAGSKSYEMHTAVSAHPFTAELPPGEYTLTVERGKEYFPITKQITISDKPLQIKLSLNRVIDMAARGWYSGDTHVHLPLSDLPTAMLAEDLNVAFPLTSWVTQAYQVPQSETARERVKVSPELVKVDDTHVYWPLNTEWEIFTVKDARHTLGAIFALGQKEPIRLGVPPVTPIAKAVRSQSGLLELDKHNWPWSMMLVPVMKVDLFELSNNHHWRAPFFFGNFNPQYAPPHLQAKLVDGKFTEALWTEFGFWNYYALLNCGFRLSPTAGNASGVHPVPLGFGRVYVELPDGFSYERWLAGLKAGRSFVTTGPLMMVRCNDQTAGYTFKVPVGRVSAAHLTGSVFSRNPLKALEVIINGYLARRIPIQGRSLENGGFETKIDMAIPLESSAWVAVRVFEQEPDGRERFAHTSPFYFDLADRPLRPRKYETEYLLGRIRDELQRHQGVLPEAALKEYRLAEKIYQELHEQAK